MKGFVVILPAVFILLLVRCHNYGVYEIKTYNTDIRLNLKRDYRFEETLIVDSQVDTFWGTWSILNDTINLTITKPKVFINIDSFSSVEEYYLPDKDSIYFETMFQNKAIAPFVHIEMKNPYCSITSDINGKIVVDKINASKFKAYSLSSLYSITYKIKNKLSNYFVIRLFKNKHNFSILRIEPKTQYLYQRNRIKCLKQSNFYLKRKLFFRRSLCKKKK